MIRTTTDGVAAVNPEVFWLPITATSKPPRGAKVLLISRPAGVAVIGQYADGDWYTHFAGLPVFKDEE